jgi:hypothetical protein
MIAMIYSDSLTTEQQESVRANSVNVVDATIERLREVRAARAQQEPGEPQAPSAPVVSDDHRSVEALSGLALNMMRDGYDNAKQDRNGKGMR